MVEGRFHCDTRFKRFKSSETVKPKKRMADEVKIKISVCRSSFVCVCVCFSLFSDRGEFFSSNTMHC